MTLEEALRWARRVTMEQVNPRHPDFADAAQEAEIAVWRLLEKTPEASPTLIATAAKRAAWGAHYRGLRTGSAGRPKGSGPAFTPESVTSVEALADAGVMDDYLPAVADHGDAVAVAAAVRAAVADLPDRHRTLLFLRFWEDRTWQETGAHFGTSKAATERTFRRDIAPVLARALSSLKAAA